MFLTTLEGVVKALEWSDLNRLKKDVLWVYDMNVGQINAAFLPDNEFKDKYWEYLYIEGDLDGEENFYKEGVLVILLCMAVEYIDTTGGNQNVFGETKASEITKYVEGYSPANDKHKQLKDILLQGLRIAGSMTPADLVNTDGYEHPEIESFYSKLPWVSQAIIEEYYRQKLK